MMLKTVPSMQSDCEFTRSSDSDESDEVSDAKCEGIELSDGWSECQTFLMAEA